MTVSGFDVREPALQRSGKWVEMYSPQMKGIKAVKQEGDVLRVTGDFGAGLKRQGAIHYDFKYGDRVNGYLDMSDGAFRVSVTTSKAFVGPESSPSGIQLVATDNEGRTVHSEWVNTKPAEDGEVVIDFEPAKAKGSIDFNASRIQDMQIKFIVNDQTPETFTYTGDGIRVTEVAVRAMNAPEEKVGIEPLAEPAIETEHRRAAPVEVKRPSTREFLEWSGISEYTDPSSYGGDDVLSENGFIGMAGEKVEAQYAELDKLRENIAKSDPELKDLSMTDRRFLFTDLKRGLDVDANGNLTIDHELAKKNLTKLIDLAKKHNVKLIPVLFDFRLFKLHPEFGLDPAKRAELIELIKPELELLGQNSEWIAAIEPVNEPDVDFNSDEKNLVTGIDPATKQLTYVPLSMRQEFVAELARAIRKNAKTPVSFSAVSRESAKFWIHMLDKSGKDVLNFHVYDNPSYTDDDVIAARGLDPATSGRGYFQNVPEGTKIIVGEYQPSTDDGKQSLARKTMSLIRDADYDGGLAWNVEKDYRVTDAKVYDDLNAFASGEKSLALKYAEMTVNEMLEYKLRDDVQIAKDRNGTVYDVKTSPITVSRRGRTLLLFGKTYETVFASEEKLAEKKNDGWQFFRYDENGKEVPTEHVFEADFAKDGKKKYEIKGDVKYAVLRSRDGQREVILDRSFLEKGAKRFTFFNVNENGEEKELDLTRWDAISDTLYLEGMGYLSHFQFDVAMDRFQKAIRINGANDKARKSLQKCQELDKREWQAKEAYMIDILNSVEGILGQEWLSYSLIARYAYGDIEKSFDKHRTVAHLAKVVDEDRARLHLVKKSVHFPAGSKELRELIPYLKSIPNLYKKEGISWDKDGVDMGEADWSVSGVGDATSYTTTQVDPTSGQQITTTHTTPGDPYTATGTTQYESNYEAEGVSTVENLSMEFDTTEAFNALFKHLGLDAKSAVLNLTITTDAKFKTTGFSSVTETSDGQTIVDQDLPDGQGGWIKADIEDPLLYGLTIEFGILPYDIATGEHKGKRVGSVQSSLWPAVNFDKMPTYEIPEELKLSKGRWTWALIEGLGKQTISVMGSMHTGYAMEPQDASWTRLGFDILTGAPTKYYVRGKLGQIAPENIKTHDAFVDVDKVYPEYESALNVLGAPMKGEPLETEQMMSRREKELLDREFDRWNGFVPLESATFLNETPEEQQATLAINAEILRDVFQSLTGRGMFPQEIKMVEDMVAKKNMPSPADLARYLINMNYDDGVPVVERIGARTGYQHIMRTVDFKDDYRSLRKNLAVDDKKTYFTLYNKIWGNDKRATEEGVAETTFYTRTTDDHRQGERSVTFTRRDGTIVSRRDATPDELRAGIKTVYEVRTKVDRETPKLREGWDNFLNTAGEGIMTVVNPNRWKNLPVVGWLLSQPVNLVNYGWDKLTPWYQGTEQLIEKNTFYVSEVENTETQQMTDSIFLAERMIEKRVIAETPRGEVTYLQPVVMQRRVEIPKRTEDGEIVRTPDGKVVTELVTTEINMQFVPDKDGDGTTGKWTYSGMQLDKKTRDRLVPFEYTGEYTHVKIGERDGLIEEAQLRDSQVYQDDLGRETEDRFYRGIKSLVLPGGRTGFSFPNPKKLGENIRLSWNRNNSIVRTHRYRENPVSGKKEHVSTDYSIRLEDRLGTVIDHECLIKLDLKTLNEKTGEVDVYVTVGNNRSSSVKYRAIINESKDSVVFEKFTRLEGYDAVPGFSHPGVMFMPGVSDLTKGPAFLEVKKGALELPNGKTIEWSDNHEINRILLSDMKTVKGWDFRAPTGNVLARITISTDRDVTGEEIPVVYLSYDESLGGYRNAAGDLETMAIYSNPDQLTDPGKILGMIKDKKPLVAMEYEKFSGKVELPEKSIDFPKGFVDIKPGSMRIKKTRYSEEGLEVGVGYEYTDETGIRKVLKIEQTNEIVIGVKGAETPVTWISIFEEDGKKIRQSRAYVGEMAKTGDSVKAPQDMDKPLLYETRDSTYYDNNQLHERETKLYDVVSGDVIYDEALVYSESGNVASKFIRDSKRDSLQTVISKITIEEKDGRKIAEERKYIVTHLPEESLVEGNIDWDADWTERSRYHVTGKENRFGEEIWDRISYVNKNTGANLTATFRELTKTGVSYEERGKDEHGREVVRMITVSEDRVFTVATKESVKGGRFENPYERFVTEKVDIKPGDEVLMKNANGEVDVKVEAPEEARYHMTATERAYISLAESDQIIKITDTIANSNGKFLFEVVRNYMYDRNAGEMRLKEREEYKYHPTFLDPITKKIMKGVVTKTVYDGEGKETTAEQFYTRNWIYMSGRGVVEKELITDGATGAELEIVTRTNEDINLDNNSSSITVEYLGENEKAVIRTIKTVKKNAFGVVTELSSKAERLEGDKWVPMDLIPETYKAQKIQDAKPGETFGGQISTINADGTIEIKKVDVARLLRNGNVEILVGQDKGKIIQKSDIPVDALWTSQTKTRIALGQEEQYYQKSIIFGLYDAFGKPIYQDIVNLMPRLEKGKVTMSTRHQILSYDSRNKRMQEKDHFGEGSGAEMKQADKTSFLIRYRDPEKSDEYMLERETDNKTYITEYEYDLLRLQSGFFSRLKPTNSKSYWENQFLGLEVSVYDDTTKERLTIDLQDLLLRTTYKDKDVPAETRPEDIDLTEGTEVLVLRTFLEEGREYENEKWLGPLITVNGRWNLDYSKGTMKEMRVVSPLEKGWFFTAHLDRDERGEYKIEGLYYGKDVYEFHGDYGKKRVREFDELDADAVAGIKLNKRGMPTYDNKLPNVAEEGLEQASKAKEDAVLWSFLYSGDNNTHVLTIPRQGDDALKGRVFLNKRRQDSSTPMFSLKLKPGKEAEELIARRSNRTGEVSPIPTDLLYIDEAYLRSTGETKYLDSLKPAMFSLSSLSTTPESAIASPITDLRRGKVSENRGSRFDVVPSGTEGSEEVELKMVDGGDIPILENITTEDGKTKIADIRGKDGKITLALIPAKEDAHWIKQDREDGSKVAYYFTPEMAPSKTEYELAKNVEAEKWTRDMVKRLQPKEFGEPTKEILNKVFSLQTQHDLTNEETVKLFTHAVNMYKQLEYLYSDTKDAGYTAPQFEDVFFFAVDRYSRSNRSYQDLEDFSLIFEDKAMELAMRKLIPHYWQQFQEGEGSTVTSEQAKKANDSVINSIFGIVAQVRIKTAGMEGVSVDRALYETRQDLIRQMEEEAIEVLEKPTTKEFGMSLWNALQKILLPIIAALAALAVTRPVTKGLENWNKKRKEAKKEIKNIYTIGSGAKITVGAEEEIIVDENSVVGIGKIDKNGQSRGLEIRDITTIEDLENNAQAMNLAIAVQVSLDMLEDVVSRSNDARLNSIWRQLKNRRGPPVSVKVARNNLVSNVEERIIEDTEGNVSVEIILSKDFSEVIFAGLKGSSKKTLGAAYVLAERMFHAFNHKHSLSKTEQDRIQDEVETLYRDTVLFEAGQTNEAELQDSVRYFTNLKLPDGRQISDMMNSRHLFKEKHNQWAQIADEEERRAAIREFVLAATEFPSPQMKAAAEIKRMPEVVSAEAVEPVVGVMEDVEDVIRKINSFSSPHEGGGFIEKLEKELKSVVNARNGSGDAQKMINNGENKKALETIKAKLINIQAAVNKQNAKEGEIHTGDIGRIMMLKRKIGMDPMKQLVGDAYELSLEESLKESIEEIDALLADETALGSLEAVKVSTKAFIRRKTGEELKFQELLRVLSGYRQVTRYETLPEVLMAVNQEGARVNLSELLDQAKSRRAEGQVGMIALYNKYEDENLACFVWATPMQKRWLLFTPIVTILLLADIGWYLGMPALLPVMAIVNFSVLLGLIIDVYKRIIGIKGLIAKSSTLAKLFGFNQILNASDGEVQNLPRETIEDMDVGRFKSILTLPADREVPLGDDLNPDFSWYEYDFRGQTVRVQGVPVDVLKDLKKDHSDLYNSILPDFDLELAVKEERFKDIKDWEIAVKKWKNDVVDALFDIVSHKDITTLKGSCSAYTLKEKGIISLDPKTGKVNNDVTDLAEARKRLEADPEIKYAIGAYYLMPLLTVYLPVFDEPNVIGKLIKNVSNLNYPKIQVLVSGEEGDEATATPIISMFEEKQIPPFLNLRIVATPQRAPSDIIGKGFWESDESPQPQTKPWATNYAVGYTGGEYAVIWDGEDAPNRDQIDKVIFSYGRIRKTLGNLQDIMNEMTEEDLKKITPEVFEETLIAMDATATRPSGKEIRESARRFGLSLDIPFIIKMIRLEKEAKRKQEKDPSKEAVQISKKEIIEKLGQIGIPAVMQCQLDWFNWNHSWTTKNFAADYETWFKILLPGLNATGTLIPLGGTSNYFFVPTLRELGGWDGFNVTEDEHLGLNIYAKGYRTAVMSSNTLEEAINDQFWGKWVNQRSRWTKGYMQTLVKFLNWENLTKIYRSRGSRGVWEFFVMIAGGAASALFFLVTVLVTLFWGASYLPPSLITGPGALVVAGVLSSLFSVHLWVSFARKTDEMFYGKYQNKYENSMEKQVERANAPIDAELKKEDLTKEKINELNNQKILNKIRIARNYKRGKFFVGLAVWAVLLFGIKAFLPLAKGAAAIYTPTIFAWLGYLPQIFIVLAIFVTVSGSVGLIINGIKQFKARYTVSAGIARTAKAIMPITFGIAILFTLLQLALLPAAGLPATGAGGIAKEFLNWFLAYRANPELAGPIFFLYSFIAQTGFSILAIWLPNSSDRPDKVDKPKVSILLEKTAGDLETDANFYEQSAKAYEDHIEEMERIRDEGFPADIDLPQEIAEEQAKRLDAMVAYLRRDENAPITKLVPKALLVNSLKRCVVGDADVIKDHAAKLRKKADNARRGVLDIDTYLLWGSFLGLLALGFTAFGVFGLPWTTWALSAFYLWVATSIIFTVIGRMSPNAARKIEMTAAVLYNVAYMASLVVGAYIGGKEMGSGFAHYWSKTGHGAEGDTVGEWTIFGLPITAKYIYGEAPRTVSTQLATTWELLRAGAKQSLMIILVAMIILFGFHQDYFRKMYLQDEVKARVTPYSNVIKESDYYSKLKDKTSLTERLSKGTMDEVTPFEELPEDVKQSILTNINNPEKLAELYKENLISTFSPREGYLYIFTSPETEATAKETKGIIVRTINDLRHIARTSGSASEKAKRSVLAFRAEYEAYVAILKAKQEAGQISKKEEATAMMALEDYMTKAFKQAGIVVIIDEKTGTVTSITMPAPKDVYEEKVSSEEDIPFVSATTLLREALEDLKDAEKDKDLKEITFVQKILEELKARIEAGKMEEGLTQENIKKLEAALNEVTIAITPQAVLKRLGRGALGDRTGNAGIITLMVVTAGFLLGSAGTSMAAGTTQTLSIAAVAGTTIPWLVAGPFAVMAAALMAGLLINFIYRLRAPPEAEEYALFDEDGRLTLPGPIVAADTVESLDEAKRAMGLGVSLIEVDVQMTKDGVLIAYWDTKVKTDKGDKYVYELTLEEVNEALQKSKNRKALEIEDLLRLIRGKAAINLDIKTWSDKVTQDVKFYRDEVLNRISSVIEDHKLARSVYVSSFYPEYISKLREMGVKVPMGTALHKRVASEKDKRHAIDEATSIGVDGIAFYPHHLNQEVIDEVKAADKIIVVYEGENLTDELRNQVDIVTISNADIKQQLGYEAKKLEEEEAQSIFDDIENFGVEDTGVIMFKMGVEPEVREQVRETLHASGISTYRNFHTTDGSISMNVILHLWGGAALRSLEDMEKAAEKEGIQIEGIEEARKFAEGKDGEKFRQWFDSIKDKYNAYKDIKNKIQVLAYSLETLQNGVEVVILKSRVSRQQLVKTYDSTMTLLTKKIVDGEVNLDNLETEAEKQALINEIKQNPNKVKTSDILDAVKFQDLVKHVVVGATDLTDAHPDTLRGKTIRPEVMNEDGILSRFVTRAAELGVPGAVSFIANGIHCASYDDLALERDIYESVGVEARPETRAVEEKIYKDGLTSKLVRFVKNLSLSHHRKHRDVIEKLIKGAVLTTGDTEAFNAARVDVGEGRDVIIVTRERSGVKERLASIMKEFKGATLQYAWHQVVPDENGVRTKMVVYSYRLDDRDAADKAVTGVTSLGSNYTGPSNMPSFTKTGYIVTLDVKDISLMPKNDKIRNIKVETLLKRIDRAQAKVEEELKAAGDLAFVTSVETGVKISELKKRIKKGEFENPDQIIGYFLNEVDRAEQTADKYAEVVREKKKKGELEKANIQNLDGLYMMSDAIKQLWFYINWPNGDYLDEMLEIEDIESKRDGKKAQIRPNTPVVLFANTIYNPTHLTHIRKLCEPVAVVSSKTTPSSHWVIVAEQEGIPVVIVDLPNNRDLETEVSEEMEKIAQMLDKSTPDKLDIAQKIAIVQSDVVSNGSIVLRPDRATVHVLRDIVAKETAFKHLANQNLTNVAKDIPFGYTGNKADLYANADTLEEITKAIIENKAAGIGLVRTEYQFMKDQATEEQVKAYLDAYFNARFDDKKQVQKTDATDALKEVLRAAYSQMAIAAGSLPVKIRTIDYDLTDANKRTLIHAMVERLNAEEEKRGDQLTEVGPGMNFYKSDIGREILAIQLEAILEASKKSSGNIEVLIPMVRDTDDWNYVMNVMGEARANVLVGMGKFLYSPFTKNREIKRLQAIRKGPMIETVEAIENIEALAQREDIDFFSIGTNDLTGYLLAGPEEIELDRTDDKNAKIFSEIQPKVQKAMNKVLLAAQKVNSTIRDHKKRKEVSICGEMAGWYVFHAALAREFEFLNIAPNDVPIRLSMASEKIPEAKMIAGKINAEYYEAGDIFHQNGTDEIGEVPVHETASEVVRRVVNEGIYRGATFDKMLESVDNDVRALDEEELKKAHSHADHTLLTLELILRKKGGIDDLPPVLVDKAEIKPKTTVLGAQKAVVKAAPTAELEEVEKIEAYLRIGDNTYGIHARPAAMIAKLYGRFPDVVFTIEKYVTDGVNSTKIVNLQNPDIMTLLTLELTQSKAPAKGDTKNYRPERQTYLKVRAEGEGAEEFIDQLLAFHVDAEPTFEVVEPEVAEEAFELKPAATSAYALPGLLSLMGTVSMVASVPIGMPVGSLSQFITNNAREVNIVVIAAAAIVFGLIGLRNLLLAKAGKEAYEKKIKEAVEAEEAEDEEVVASDMAEELEKPTGLSRVKVDRDLLEAVQKRAEARPTKEVIAVVIGFTGVSQEALDNAVDTSKIGGVKVVALNEATEEEKLAALENLRKEYGAYTAGLAEGAEEGQFQQFIDELVTDLEGRDALRFIKILNETPEMAELAEVLESGATATKEEYRSVLDIIARHFKVTRSVRLADLSMYKYKFDTVQKDNSIVTADEATVASEMAKIRGQKTVAHVIRNLGQLETLADKAREYRKSFGENYVNLEVVLDVDGVTNENIGQILEDAQLTDVITRENVTTREDAAELDVDMKTIDGVYKLLGRKYGDSDGYIAPENVAVAGSDLTEAGDLTQTEKGYLEKGMLIVNMRKGLASQLHTVVIHLIANGNKPSAALENVARLAVSIAGYVIFLEPVQAIDMDQLQIEMDNYENILIAA